MHPKSNTDKKYSLIILIINKVFSLITLWLILDFIRDEDVVEMVQKNPFEAFAFVIGIGSIFVLGKVPFQNKLNNSYSPMNYPNDDLMPQSQCPNYLNCKKDNQDVH